MKLEEIPWSQRVEYTEICSCGKEHAILTQGGEGEYNTEIYVKCDCGNYVEFILPVN